MDIRTSTLIAGGLHSCSPAWSLMSGQYADCHRLYFVRAGNAEFFYGKFKWRLEAGRVYLLPGYAWVHYQCRRAMRVDWLHFRPESLELDGLLAQRPHGMSWPASHWSRWKGAYTRIVELFDSQPPDAAALSCEIQSMLLWMFAQLLSAPTRRKSDPHLPLFEQLKPALVFMDQNFAQNPSLDEVAAAVHLSPVYFHRCFKHAYHITPHDYLIRKRMQRAWELLREDGVTVGAAAERLGFSNPFYFSRAFRRFYGVKPVDVKLRRVRPGP